MYQSGSNTPKLAEAWAQFAEMDPHEAIDVALEVADGLGDDEFYESYLVAHGDDGLRALVAAITVIPHLHREDELYNMVMGDISHDFGEHRKGLVFLPRTMSRFEVDDIHPAFA